MVSPVSPTFAPLRRTSLESGAGRTGGAGPVPLGSKRVGWVGNN